jgi:DNA-binding transcriptional MerR regulator
MKNGAEPRWTIDELGARTSQVLAVDYDGPPNDRVRDVPDQRTIRYYTTLGLIDRPAAMRGRTALYGRRHLLQLVAIKRLQAKGHSLAEIQAQLLGLTNAALGRLARVTAKTDAPAALPSRNPARSERTSGRRAEAFWRAAPAPVARGRIEADAGASAHATNNDSIDARLTLQGIRLTDDLTILLTTRRLLDDDDTLAIREAAQPLLQLLQTRRLIRPRDERGTR